MNFFDLQPSEYLERIKTDVRKLINALIGIIINIIGLIVAVMRSDSPYKWLLPALPVLLVIILLVFRACDSSSQSDDDDFEYSVRVERPEKAHRISTINYRRSFNDMNDEHLATAKKIGIKPILSRDDIDNASRPLQKTDDDESYKVDKLTHSIPYLVPQAAELLSVIGKNFQDSLLMKHLPPAKIIVTSILRTQNDVKRLSRGNVNASKNSAHCYATTFDITYKRFYTKNGDTTDNSAKYKAVLAEVLRDLKKQDYCFIKHEVKQACFHITARK